MSRCRSRCRPRCCCPGSPGIPGTHGVPGPAGPSVAGQGYASGPPIVLSAISSLPETRLVGLVGSGNSASGVTLLSAGVTPTLDITNPGIALFSQIYVAPQARTFTSLYAYFQLTAGITVGGTVSVNVSLYTAPTTGNIFTRANSTLVTLTPTLTGVVNIGTLLSGSAALAFSVPAGTRYTLVYDTESTGLTVLLAIAGTASAGLTWS